ncbi:MAG: hypothetical protein ACUVUF_08445, partial [Candidatus Bathycorpusculaceae bacterium]
GGPPVVWIIVPTWVIGGIVIDLFFHVTRQKIRDSRLVPGIAGLIYNIPGDLLLYWAFNSSLVGRGHCSFSSTASSRSIPFWAA